jgi:ribosomal-protein-alanine N-acetyltransferase
VTEVSAEVRVGAILPHMVPVLETERLILRPLELADAGAVQRLFPRWEIVEFLNAAVPWPYPEDGALTNIRDVTLPAMERGDQWDWTSRLKTKPEEVIGRIGLHKGEDNRGFWIGVPWQGQGLMTEAVIAVTDFWFGELGFDVMRVPKAIANVASRRISEKLGMRVVETKERDYVSGRLPSEIWEITAAEWRAWRAMTK